MSHLHLFAYGTLQVPEVMQSVTGRAFAACPARLDGYSRHGLRGRSFPGIRPNPGHSVEGTLFADIDEESLRRLDAFEDDFYRRETVATVDADGNLRDAQAYVVREEAYGLLLPEDWDLRRFREACLERFLARHE